MSIPFDQNKAIYLQLADKVLDDIEAGRQAEGSRMLSVREYATTVGVNANTVMRTYAWLQQEGIIFNKRGIGYFIADDARSKVAQMRREAFMDRELPYFLQRLSILGFAPDQLKDIYTDFLKNGK